MAEQIKGGASDAPAEGSGGLKGMGEAGLLMFVSAPATILLQITHAIIGRVAD